MARQSAPSAVSRARFLTMLDHRALSGAWLMEGSDAALRDDAIGALKKALLAPGMESLDCAMLEQPAFDVFAAACETVPFMSEKRIVIVHPVGQCESDEKLCEYLPRVPGSCLALFLYGESADRRKQLPKALAKLDHIVRFDPMGEDELREWIVGRFADRGLVCDPKAARELMAISGMDSTLLSGEVDKLAAVAAEEGTVTVGLVQRCATRTAEYNVFRVVDAVVDGRAEEAVSQVQRLLTDGEEPLMILSLLLRQYRLLQNIKIFQHEKLPRQAWEQQLKIQPFQVDRLTRQAARLSGREVRDALALCLETEYRVKSGQIRDRAALEAVLARIILIRQHRLN